MQPVFVISLVLLWAIVFFNLLLTISLIRRVNEQTAMPSMETLKIGKLAPAFTAQMLTGETVTLTDFAGKRVFLVFISPSCAPCREKIPELQALAPKLAQEGIVFALLFSETVQEIRPFVAKYSLSIPVWLAPPPNPLWQDYKVAGTPFYCAIEANHEVALTGFFESEWELVVKQWATDE